MLAFGCFKKISTHPPNNEVRPIVVHDNCMIGISSIIMPDVEIGPNSVVGAGSIVTRDVPPNTAYASNPAEYIESYDEYLEKSRLTEIDIESAAIVKEPMIQKFKNK
jgi:acetyltransferase-like isoleucine patch superfamily enzyme